MMNEFKHTPGPWYTGKARNWDQRRVYADIEEGVSVCVADADQHDNPGAQYANAHLIAAAPELLEALDELANGYSGNGWDVGLVKRLEKARAAIAKALGEDK